MSLAVERYETGPIGTNCYVVRKERGAKEAVVVDPSGDAAQLRLELARMGATCVAILVTHGHFDHVYGMADLAEGTGATLYGPAGEEAELTSPGGAQYGLSIRGRAPDATVAEGDTVEVAGIAFEVVSVPGHSPAHVAFHADGHLFSGDVLFAGSVGRTDLPGQSWETLLASIRTLVDRYPAETVVHPGHGPETTLGRELATNPFLAELRAERQA